MHPKLQPLDLANVPADLAWCVYEEERERGSVYCEPNAFQVVLALRWLLTYTNWGIEEEFETYKVYWNTQDDCGFRTQIFLFREKVEQFCNFEMDWVVAQEPLWVRLATICSTEGAIDRVEMSGSSPYGEQIELNGKMGIVRLLVDAAYASQATHHTTPVLQFDETYSVYRCDGGGTLSFTLSGKYNNVSSLNLRVEQERY